MVEEARAVIKLYKLDKESDFSSASVDDVIGWTGVAPTGQLGIGAGKRRSDLVRFISGITGSNVTLISRKITADLKQIVAKHSLVINNQSAEAGSAWPSQNWQGNSNNPRDYSYKKEWGVHAGISFGMDGTVTPSFNPSYTRNGVRTSAHISPDLFTGLKAMSSWLDNVLKPAMHISTVPNNEKLAQKLAALEQELPELYDSLTPADQMKAQQVIKAVKRVEADVMAAAQEPVDSKAMGIMYGKLKLLALKIEHYLHQYQTFADESPIKARVYLVSAMIGAKGIAGAIMGAISTAGVGVVPGFLAGIGKGVADEVRGGGVTALAVGDLVANAIDYGLQKFAPLLMDIDPTLTHSQAILLGSILATTAFSAREFTNFARSFRPRLATGVPIPKSINVGKGSSASGTVWLKTQSSKYKPLTTSTKTDNLNNVMDKTVRQLGRATQVQSGQTAGRASSAPISKTPKPLLQNFKNSQDLEAHFNKHRSEWGDISAYQYLSKARALLKQDADKNILQKIRVHNGDMVKYDLKNNQMVIARNDGSIRTFFRPKNGIEYWNQLK
jgi:hypothetical protein